LPKDEKDPAGLSEIDEFAQPGRQQSAEAILHDRAEVDGAAAESHEDVPAVVYHLLGDEKFAKFLKTQPLAYQMSGPELDRERSDLFPALFSRNGKDFLSPRDRRLVFA
jgi:hypothetical protein